MKKLSLTLIVIGCLVSVLNWNVYAEKGRSDTPTAKDAKLVASWDKTLTYNAGETETTFQSAIYDSACMLVTTAKYTPYPENQLTSLTYVLYDKKDKEKATGSFTVVTGEDAFVDAIEKNTVLLVRTIGSYNYETGKTEYTKYAVEIYKISKNEPKKIGGPFDLASVNGSNFANDIDDIFFIGGKVYMYFTSSTGNWLWIFDKKLAKYVNVTGTANSDILTDSQMFAAPKYFNVDDTTYSEDYTKTYKKVKIYK